MEMSICGSCYNLIATPKHGNECPRCQEALEPTPEDRLRKFIRYGTDTTRKGVPLSDAQKAAAKVLEKLLQAEGANEGITE